ncbi:1758_t:CDS:10 [Entrophospora sp. SA101]|nr:1758_t:CDS:10 [Entrophospora sp. SA101]
MFNQKKTGPAIRSFFNEQGFIDTPLNSRILPPSTRQNDIYEKELKIGLLSLQVQEYAIMEDLLFVMMGIDGKYIKSNSVTDNFTDKPSLTYSVDLSLDPSLRDLAERILPLATYYTSINAFIELHSKFEYGFVSHALCAAMREILKEYLILINQLEYQFRTESTFTLQKFWFHVHSTLYTMSNLHSLILEIQDAAEDAMEEDTDMMMVNGFTRLNTIPQRIKGGGILTILVDRMTTMSGDPSAKKLYLYLLSKSSQPYVTMLHLWIHHGEIRDPYEEYMIQERKNVKKENLKDDFNDAYWEMRYTIRDTEIPPFLIPFKYKILLAGKYLNVVRECGIPIIQEQQKQNSEDEDPINGKKNVDRTDVNVNNDILTAMDGGRFVENIETAYKRANRTLLDLLLKDHQLIAHLAALELKKPSTQVSLTKLQSLLDLVIHNPSSAAYTDPFKEDLKVDMSSVGLVDQLLRIINIAGTIETIPTTSKASNRISETFIVRKDTNKIVDESENEGSEDGGGSSSSENPGGGGYAGSVAGSLAGSMAGSIVGSMLGGSSGGSGGTKQLLTGIEALTFDYIVPFPLSLVISRKSLTKYQLLFRHLFYLKHAEQLLYNTWKEHTKSYYWKHGSGHPSIEGWKGQLYALRQKMIVFVQQFIYYVTSEASTVDQVLKYHSDFLDTCLKECMLTNAKLLRVEKFTKSLVSLETQVESMTTIIQMDYQDRTLRKFEEHFVYHIKLLIEALNFYSATETASFLYPKYKKGYFSFKNTNSQDYKDAEENLQANKWVVAQLADINELDKLNFRKRMRHDLDHE